jgi:hypothetical protein
MDANTYGNLQRRYDIAEMAADARRKGQSSEYLILRTAVYDLFVLDGWGTPDPMTDDLIDSYYARCDVV